jgi:hypothetical protein
MMTYIKESQTIILVCVPLSYSPVVLESEHYPTVKKNGLWLGKNGKETIPAVGYSGAKIFREAIKLEHATYIGFHGYAGEYLADNPDLALEMLNLCGYWYFPGSVTIKRTGEKSFTFDIEWLNKGVAPAYNVYQLRGKLTNVKRSDEPVYFIIQDPGNRKWLPGTSVTETYSPELKEKLKGTYALSIKLWDSRSERPVEVGLKELLRDPEGYYLMGSLNF